MIDFAEINRKAAERVKQQWRDYVPLPRACAYTGFDPETVSRPTERYAMLSWLRGDVSSAAQMEGFVRVGSAYEHGWISTYIPPVLASRKVACETHRICKKCGCTYPLNRTYWHKNASSRLGYNTICKKCRA